MEFNGKRNRAILLNHPVAFDRVVAAGEESPHWSALAANQAAVAIATGRSSRMMVLPLPSLFRKGSSGSQNCLKVFGSKPAPEKRLAHNLSTWNTGVSGTGF